MSTVWCQLDSLGPQLSPTTSPSCKNQESHLELRQLYDFLTRLCPEFEPVHGQLLAHHPSVSLVDALTAVRTEEVRLHSAGLLQHPSVLATHSVASTPVAPYPAAPSHSGGRYDLHCKYCDKDGHLESYCFKKKDLARRDGSPPKTSDGLGTESYDTQEILMLLRRLATSTSLASAASVTQTSASSGSAGSATLPPSTSTSRLPQRGSDWFWPSSS
uniref:Uncharacterized protein n=1 Tax=Arundo donax TaxID=35708 RepID=A0A0A9U0D3_ARUDO